jgi:hypothetical protein
MEQDYDWRGWQRLGALTQVWERFSGGGLTLKGMRWIWLQI